jgi:adenylate cyclase
MSDIFISYARSTAKQAQAVAEALRALGYHVWRDDELPAHRAYAEVIEERLAAARAVVVIWSAEAAKSQWVFSEANRAREDGKLVQLTVDDARLPMPFDTIQCADLAGWSGDPAAPGWRKVVDSVAALVAGAGAAAAASEAAPALPAKPSIAVLPFANLSGDPEQDYFADGMVVEIVSALSRFKSIFVIAAGSSLSLKGKGLSPQAAAAQLGVRFVLEGSVRKAGGKVRIAVQLIEAQDGGQIWTHRFEDTLEDIFALQDKVALTVGAMIEPTIATVDTRRVVKRPTENMGSYDCCLRARSVVAQLTEASVAEGLRLAERAIALDPDYGEAATLAARMHFLAGLYGWTDAPADHTRTALELARRAVRLAGDDAEVISQAAVILVYLDDDTASAVALADKALGLNPGSVTVWQSSGVVRLQIGDTDLAVEHFETAMRLDPMGPDRTPTRWGLTMARFQQGRFAEAAALARQMIQTSENPTSYALLAASLGHLGQPTAAAEALAGYRRRTPQPVETYARAVWRDPAPRKLFLDGIALAEARDPAEASSG